MPFLSVECFKTQAAISLKFGHPRIRLKDPKAYLATTMLKKLIDLFQDMIEGATISKPAILERLANEELGKTMLNDYTIAQIVRRLK